MQHSSAVGLLCCGNNKQNFQNFQNFPYKMPAFATMVLERLDVELGFFHLF